MSKVIIVDKTIEGAIKKAVEQLAVSSEEDLNINILENPTKGFLGFGSKSAKIEVEVKEKEELEVDLTFNVSLDEEEPKKEKVLNSFESENNVEEKELLAKDFLNKIFEAMDVKADFIIRKSDKYINIYIKSDKDSVLIGRRGKTLESLEFLTNLSVNKGESRYVNIYLDVGRYKEKRKRTLEQLAHSISKKVYQEKHRHALEPMSRFERKIIHNTLQSNPHVRTYSEGVEPNRYIVIDIK